MGKAAGSPDATDATDPTTANAAGDAAAVNADATAATAAAVAAAMAPVGAAASAPAAPAAPPVRKGPIRYPLIAGRDVKYGETIFPKGTELARITLPPNCPYPIGFVTRRHTDGMIVEGPPIQ